MDRTDQPTHGESPGARARDDRGSGIVELSLILLVLSFFLFGIISFGYLFSFRQNLTQAAAEGARAGALAASTSTAQTDADNAVKDAVLGSFGKSCTSGNGLSCTTAVAACSNAPSQQCVTVTLVFSNTGSNKILDLPIMNTFMPSTVTVSSTARVT